MENNKLTGFASLPADTFAEGPQSGADRGDGEPISANGRTGPFDEQPVQGFSGVQFAPDGNGSFWFLSDNGFGNQRNSADYLLRLYQAKPNFKTESAGDGTVAIEGFVQLSDPDNQIPFDIVNEGTTERLLTGADFDIESFVIDAKGDIWIGDEFGPFLLHFDSTGKLLSAPIPTPNIPDLNTLNGQDPIIIGHRGASGPRPEHTLNGFRLALEQGSDFIETDYVMTKDGVPIVRHEPLLNNTTDILDRPEFADRKTTKVIDGVEITGFFAEDFTLAEIKTLRARQPRSERSDVFDDNFEIPTMAEVIQLVKDFEAETGKKVGIVHELKHNTYFDSIGLNLEEATVRVLIEEDFTNPEQNIIQTFEIAPLIRLDKEIMPEAGIDVPLHQLTGAATENFNPGFSFPYDIVANFSNPDFTQADARNVYGDLVDVIDLNAETGYGDLLALPEFYEFVATYAEALNPWKNTILLRERLAEPVDGDGNGVAEIRSQLTGEVFPLIDLAHDAGLLVNVYTLRDEERYLALNPDGSVQTPTQEAEDLIRLGADGLIGDSPLTIGQVRDQIVAGEVRSPQNPNLQFNTLNGDAPLVIGHRGASGELPEHTLEAYARAIAQGADFIEPDLAITKDGVLIARHEPLLDDTTNVAEVFGPERQSTKILDGEVVTGYFAEDFTLAEIKQLRAVQPRSYRDSSFDGLFEIPTLEEIIELVQQVEAETGVQVGIYPETKHPTFFQEQDLPLEKPLIETLIKTGFTDPNRIFIQSFEVQNLIELDKMLDEAGRKTVTGIDFIGGVNFETGFIFDGTEVGGISGITYDAANNLYYGLSDDRGNRGTPVDGAAANEPARFYNIAIDLSDGSLDDGDVTFEKFTTLSNVNGTPFAPSTTDPEGIALTDDGNLFISSEGDANNLISPFVAKFSLDGQILDSLTIPEKFLPTADQSSGIQNNQAFESLTITPNQEFLFTATENALFQDGERASLETGSPVRIIQYNVKTGEPVGEFVYFNDPIPVASEPAGGFADNGLVELLAIDDAGTLLAMERSFAVGVGNNIRIYEINLNGATDVSDIDSLTGEDIASLAVEKRLIADLGADFGIRVDNDEALAFGPTLPDGKQSLVVVSDNNFNANGQVTQFLAFSLDIEGTKQAEDLADIPLVQLFGDTNGDFINEGGGGFSVPYDFVANFGERSVDSLEFLGIDLIPGDLTVDGTEVGGLSGLGLQPGTTDTFYAISDDYQGADARFYNLTIDLSDGSLDTGDITIDSTTSDPVFFLDNDGTTFTSDEVGEVNRGLDAEGLAFLENGNLLISSEGRGVNADPFIREYTLDGTLVNELPVDEKHLSTIDPDSGVRNSGGFESLTITPDQQFLFAGNEKTLIQDGSEVDYGQIGLSRIVKYDLTTGEPIAEFVYQVTTNTLIPEDENGNPDLDGGKGSGLVELLALDENRLFALEREFAAGVTDGEGSRPVRLYEIDLSNATNVIGDNSLEDVDFAPASKRLIFDFDELLGESGIERIGSMEALAFAPDLPDGRKVLLVMEDNDFSSNDGDRDTQVMAFAINPYEFDQTKAEQIYGEELANLIDFSASPTYENLANQDVINVISNYAEGLGPWKNNILLRESIDQPVDGNGDGVAEITTRLTGEIFPLIDFAHNADLQIHPYTLRDEERFLTLNPDGTPQTPEDEFRQLIELGVDGFFTDFPETGRTVVDQEIELPNLRASRGYEGMAFSPDRQTLYPMLEGTVVGDPTASLRIYEFDVATSAFTGLVGLYQMDAANHAIGDFTPINDNEFLVIERDGRQGEAAQFKKIFKVDFSTVDSNGFVEKTEVVDLLNIDDPNDLNGDGKTTFEFPFVTIEDILVMDENTILVANDNNYPFSVGRGPDIDNNEIILIDLAEPLDLDPRLGIAGQSAKLVSGTSGDDIFFIGNSGNPLDSENEFFVQDQLFVQYGGDNLIVGGAGADQFWIVNGEIPQGVNTIVDFEIGTDVIGILGSDSLGISEQTLTLNENNGDTSIDFNQQTLVVLNGVTGLDFNSFVFA